jgi:hypothetical protein
MFDMCSCQWGHSTLPQSAAPFTSESLNRRSVLFVCEMWRLVSRRLGCRVHVTAIISSIIISGIRRRGGGGGGGGGGGSTQHAARMPAAAPRNLPLCHQHFAVREARIVAAVTAADRAIKNCKQR